VQTSFEHVKKAVTGVGYSALWLFLSFFQCRIRRIVVAAIVVVGLWFRPPGQVAPQLGVRGVEDQRVVSSFLA